MIDKLEVRDNHLYVTSKVKSNNPKILIISHGSGGISDIDLSFASTASDYGYEVAIPDHFTKRGISFHKWTENELNPSFQDRRKDVLDLMKAYDCKKILGISAGGTTAISMCSHVESVFAIYPALACIHQNMLQSNISIVAGKQDNWCPINHARNFSKWTGSSLYELDAEHGFLNPRHDKYLPNVFSLRGIDLPIPTDECYEKLELLEKGVRVKYSESARKKTFDLFEKWIKS